VHLGLEKYTMPVEKYKSDSSYCSSSDSEADQPESAHFHATDPSKVAGIKRIITASAALKELPSKSTNTTSKKKKKEINSTVATSPKRKVYKKNNKSSWPNIFAQSKAVVSISSVKTDSLACPGINISYYDADFLSTFGYADCGSGLLLTSMMGKASSMDTLRKIESLLRLGRTATEYINLYRSDGITPLSCHLSLLPLKSHKVPVSAVTSASSSPGSGGILWGVITIRSASCVGNARFSGLSFLGMDRVSDAVRQDYYNTKIINIGTDTTNASSNLKSVESTLSLDERKRSSVNDDGDENNIDEALV
jgi:hypothetical protein